MLKEKKYRKIEEKLPDEKDCFIVHLLPRALLFVEEVLESHDTNFWNSRLVYLEDVSSDPGCKAFGNYDTGC